MKNRFYIFTLFFLLLACRKTNNILTPAQSIADFELEEGFVAECVAAEPLVEDPVAISFDEAGRMWVVEMRGYMPDENGLGEDKPVGRIKFLEDKDSNGIYEKATVFLDSLVMPRAVCPVYGGVLVAVPPALWFYELSTHQRRLVDSTYAEGGNVEHQANGLLPGLDNWIYSAKSDKRYKLENGRWIIEHTAFRGQWGIAQDDAGRLFYNNNSVTFQADQCTPSALPALSLRLGDKVNGLFGNALVSNRVFPRVATPGVNRGYEKGVLDSTGRLVNVTAACGPTVYRGNDFPDRFYGNAFVAEPAAQLIKRIVLTESNDSLTGRFAYEGREFLTATDERFRPVFTTTGPDGALYVVDMHRGLIQHSTYLTNHLRSQVRARKLDQPTGMGRIYRIRWKQKPLPKPFRMDQASVMQLVDDLKHPNGWVRDKAHWLLIDRLKKGRLEIRRLEIKRLEIGRLEYGRLESTSDSLMREQSNAIEKLNNLIGDQYLNTALHALYVLDGLGNLTDRSLIAFMGVDTSSQRRKVAMLLAAKNGMLPFFQTLRRPSNPKLEMQYVGAYGIFCRNQFNEIRPSLSVIAGDYATDSLMAAIFAGRLWEQATQEQMAIIVSDCSQAGVPQQSCVMQWLSVPPKKEVLPSQLAHFSKGEREFFEEGKGFYKGFCEACHGPGGEGIPMVAPPLKGSEWVMHEDKSVSIRLILGGKSGPITVAGKSYTFSASMPAFQENQAINDGTIAKILTFIRNAWGNQASPVRTEEVTRVRIKPLGRVQTTKQNPIGMGFTSATDDPDDRIADNLPVGFRFRHGRRDGIVNFQAKHPEIVNPVQPVFPPKAREKNIFNEKDLRGWRPVGGKATYEVVDKMIVGSTVMNTPNTFLVSDARFTDFVLELDVWVDSTLNSGIQIRSNSYPDYNDGVFHGYQVEIDPSPRAWSGGIYDESRRGWLQNPEGKPAAQHAFRNGVWNHYKIEARGPRLRTWINDIPVADLTDNMTLSGHIGLQVHAIGGDSAKANKVVKWRHLKLINLGAPIWSASSESPTNKLTSVLDHNPQTSWQGEWLMVDLQRLKRHMIEISGAEIGVVEYSADGKHWFGMQNLHKKEKPQENSTFKGVQRCRYVRLKSMGNVLKIREVDIR